MVHFGTGQINLKNPTKQELLTINNSERKLLSVFRKMDAGLQKECLDNLGKSLDKTGTNSRTVAKKRANKKKANQKKTGK
ncbi:MAG: hypothetical protein IIB46_02070 [Nitrospinae bacterium]|nr:hypothetical protein [Nitrospinota bacterium]